MLIGISPFFNHNEKLLFENITEKNVIFPDPSKHKILVEDRAKDLIIKLLEKDPNLRLGSKEDVEEIMRHDYFKDIDLNLLYEKKIKPEFIPIIKDKYDCSYFSFDSKGEVRQDILPLNKKLEASILFEEEFKDFNEN